MSKQYFQPIPSNLNPAGRRCFKMYVPDDAEWIRMFWGFMWGLTRWYTYERDNSESGAQIGAVWKQIWLESHAAFDNETDCDTPPITEFIREWEEELSLKCNIRWCDGELQVLDCDEWIPVPVCDDGPNPVQTGQPSAQERPIPSASKCFGVSLQANGQWLLPFPVQDGDTISITNIIGNWTDGAGFWYCPDGTPFSLGICFGSRSHDGGDLDPTAYHMQVVADIGGAYFPATDGDFDVPPGTGVQQLVFRANDGTPADNAGAVSFTVCVTNNTTPPAFEWTHTFDFTVSQAGWGITFDSGIPDCVYDSGQGFAQNFPTGGDSIDVYSPNMAPVGVVKSFTAFCTHGFDGTNPELKLLSGVTLIDSDPGSGLTTQVIDLSANTTLYTSLRFVFDPRIGAGEAWPYHITKFVLSGTGYDPFV